MIWLAAAAASIALCESCHGPNGNSTTAKIPSIAAQPVTFLENQLVYFREELRPAPVMQGVTKGMTDADISAVAKHFNAQKAKPPAGSAPDEALTAKGRELTGKLHCGQCHMPQFQGQSQMARLAGQREDYLLDALTGYREGKRSGADTTMTEVLVGTSDDDLKALAHFLAHAP
jgi:cytochrome c553